MKVPNFKNAACEGLGSDNFFMPDKDSNEVNNYDETLLARICSNCVEKEECFEYAINHVRYGWWGGTSERTRIKLRKKLGIQLKGDTGLSIHDKS
jgi:hypothetical protein